MAFTQIQICNNALDFIGAQPITDIDATDDASALVLARQWTFALREFVEAYPWGWAKVRTTLNAESPAPDFSWSYIYTLPDDFVTLVGLNETYVDTPSDLYEINGESLLCDVGDTVDIEYIKIFVDLGSNDVDDYLALMDGSCATALAVLLASKIAPAICKDGVDGRSAQLLQRYLTVDLPRARVRWGNAQRRAPEFPAATSTSLSARRYWPNR